VVPCGGTAMRTLRKRIADGVAWVRRFLRQVRWEASRAFRFRDALPAFKNMKGGIPYNGTLLLSLATEKEERNKNTQTTTLPVGRVGSVQLLDTLVIYPAKNFDVHGP